MSTALAVIERALPAEMAENALQLLDERELAKLTAYVEEIEDLTMRATEAPITSKVEAATLAELMARGARAEKDLEALRKARVAPLRAEVASIDALFKRILAPLADLDGRAKRQLGAWNAAEAARVQREQEAARRKQEEAAAAEAEAERKRRAAEDQERVARQRAAEAASLEERRKREAEASEARHRQALAAQEAQAASMAQAAAVVAEPAPAARGVRTDSGSVSQVTRWTFEVLDPAQVPREYLTVDEKAIRRAVLAGVREVPGVNIYPEAGLRVRVGA